MPHKLGTRPVTGIRKQQQILRILPSINTGTKEEGQKDSAQLQPLLVVPSNMQFLNIKIRSMNNFKRRAQAMNDF